ncbi:unnamed protein product [Diatraea saccharalis]|uniref:PHD-type domain-containing protein n=1 Tax=Diatraea saccharalis TaxID=40085 RepID=A0A9N9WGA6_9NEOP|nr:unnamed protein product [Diatraea saccharalis]
MSNVSYDLDTSGGLMPLIRALIKPPDEDANAQKPKKPQHPYYKRPGKGHNHDSCDACGEGGDLICCDRCPASFHLGCYDPPLDEQDIPAGLWLCRECRASDAEKPPSSRGSRPQSPIESNDRKTRSLRNSRANSAKKKSKEDEEEDKKEIEELTPMEILVKAARIMNPRQFELPREMRVPCLFPGTEKVSVDSWGCVPLPAKLCFVCEGTCKAAPLLQCDYCPLLYHQASLYIYTLAILTCYGEDHLEDHYRKRKFIPRILREALEIKKHVDFNRDESWHRPPAWDPIISLIKSQSSSQVSFCKY